MSIAQLIGLYNEALTASLEQYNDGLLSAKEYLENNIIITLDYLKATESYKDTYEK